MGPERRVMWRNSCAEALEPRRMLAFPLGGEFTVNSSTNDIENTPQVAMDPSGDFVVVWGGTEVGDPGNPGVAARRFDQSGIPQGDQFAVNTYSTGIQYHPAVAMNAAGDFVIAWTSIEQNGVYARRYNVAGAPMGDEFRVNQDTSRDLDTGVKVAVNAQGDFVIAWRTRRDSDPVIASDFWLRTFDSEGIPTGNEFVPDQSWPGINSVCVDPDGDLVIAWAAPGSAPDIALIRARRYDNKGTALGKEYLVSNGNAYDVNASIAMDSEGDYVITWVHNTNPSDPYTTGQDIYAREYDRNDTAVGPAFVVNSYTTGYNSDPAVGVGADGSFVITWHGMNGLKSDALFARQYDSAGIAAGTEFLVNTEATAWHKKPDVGMDAHGGFIIVWDRGPVETPNRDIHAQRYGVPAVADGALVISGTAGNDQIDLELEEQRLIVTESGASVTYEAADILRIEVYANDGNDRVTIGPGVIGTYVLGGNGNDTLLGGDGNDSLVGASGKDSIDGGGGDDRVAGGKHGDILRGGAGNDRVYGDEAVDWVDGGLDRDRIYGGEGDDTIFGNNQNDTIYGEGGNDSIDGGNHHDRIDGGAGMDTIFGQRGNDVIWGNDGVMDLINGGADSDTAYVDLLDSVSLVELLV